jgi:NAD(P)-dependent dehydrogenase (short-subunit alcohol dehydrogenase family)
MAHVPGGFRGKVVLVTGAGSGIGKETALAFARAGADLLLCDVNEDGLGRTAGEVVALGRTAFARRVDVSKRHEMEAFAKEVHADHSAVDILVNNAGVGLGANFMNTTLEDWEWVLSVNLWGVIHACHFFIPPMVARGQGGHVVNVSSGAGYWASSLLTAYSTSKFGVLGLSEALRDELSPHRIGVSTICPGLINTPITQTSRLKGVPDEDEARRRIQSMYVKRGYGPEKVAAAIVNAVHKNRSVVPVTPEAWLMYGIKRLAPDLGMKLVGKLAKRMFK